MATELTPEWIKEKTDYLEAKLASKIPGDVLLGSAAALDNLSVYLEVIYQEAMEAAEHNPYAVKAVSDAWNKNVVPGLESSAGYYRRLASLSSESGPNAWLAFVSDSLRDNFKRTVKTVAAALENTPYLSIPSLDSLENKLKAAAPSQVREDWAKRTPSQAFLDYMKASKAREKVLRLLDKSGTYNPLKEVRDFLDQLSKASNLKVDLVRELSIGKAKLVILDPEANPARDKAVIESYRKAHALLAKKGLDAVWYGVLFYRSSEAGSLKPDEAAALNKAGYDVVKFNGSYDPGTDEVNLYQTPGPLLIDTLTHELGHRYWYKLIRSEQRNWFQDMVKTRPLTAEPEPDFIESMDYFPGEKDQEGYLKPVRPVTLYGGTNAQEAFAEAFMYYVTGRGMDRDQIESFGKLVKIAYSEPLSMKERIASRYKEAVAYKTMRTLADAWIAKNPSWAERVNKALALTPGVEDLGNWQYKVEGENDDYIVTVKGTQSSCTCPDSRRGNHCKHRLACALLYAAERREREMPSLV